MWLADPFTDSGIGQVTLAVTGVIVAGGVLFKPIRGLWKFGRGLAQFVTDWHGVPGRDGVEGRTGMMAWRHQVDSHMAAVKHQLETNGGGSLHDKVNNLVVDLRSVKAMAGEAATAASIAQEVGRHNERMLVEQSAEALRHVEEAHVREQFYLSALHELGIDLDPSGE